MKRISKRTKIYTVLVMFVLLVVGNTIYRNFYLSDEKIKYGVALITNVIMDYKTRIIFEFEFIVDNRKYNGSKRVSRLSYKESQSFIGKWFPIAYGEDNVDVNTLLITPKDFNKYKLPYPDSLNWVKGYFK